MISSFLLSLREGLEAALILGIVLGALVRLNRRELRQHVWRGALLAALLAGILAAIFNVLGLSLEGAAEEIFEGLTMLLAAGILTWMIFWMRRIGGSLKSELEAETRRAAAQGSSAGLFALAFLAVFREGLELALFLTAARMTAGAVPTLAGAVLGLAAAAVLGWILFATTRRLSLRRFFTVTNVLLVFFAAGLVGTGIHELNEAGWIPAVADPLYNLNPLLDETQPAGVVLKTLFGYNGNPSLTETLAYLGYLLAAWLAFRPQPHQVEREQTSAAD